MRTALHVTTFHAASSSMPYADHISDVWTSATGNDWSQAHTASEATPAALGAAAATVVAWGRLIRRSACAASGLRGTT
jgi:hypothetical protein